MMERQEKATVKDFKLYLGYCNLSKEKWELFSIEYQIHTRALVTSCAGMVETRHAQIAALRFV